LKESKSLRLYGRVLKKKKEKESERKKEREKEREKERRKKKNVYSLDQMKSLNHPL